MNDPMKQSVLGMWFLLLLGMLFGSEGVARISNYSFVGIAVVHVIEFLLKRGVLAKAGGSMGQHFLQVMMYGVFHWKPLEDQQAGTTSEGH